MDAPVWLAALLAATAAASIAYTAFALARVLAARIGPRDPATATPFISVLKPLAGSEPQLEENLRSFCEQDYPAYEVLFCARDDDDPALAAARRIRDAMPDRAIEVVSGGGPPLENPKIENLEAALGRARGDIVLVADSDMTVNRSYLREVAEAFSDERVGAVTALYGARSVDALAAHIGALYVNDQFAPSVLVATAVEPLRYCFGATMALRARVLDEIGGLRALGATIADDYVLGALVSARGYRVALTSAVPLTLVSETKLRDVLSREIRWARTIRSRRPAGYAGTVLALPMLFGAATVAAAPGLAAAWALWAAAIVLRLALHVAAQRRFAPEQPLRPWLVPLREAASAFVWCAGLAGRSATWRHGRVRVRANGCSHDATGKSH